jgi:hypothetical protein
MDPLYYFTQAVSLSPKINILQHIKDFNYANQNGGRSAGSTGK